LLRQAKVNVMGDTVPPPGVVAQLFTEQPR
jgi:hypothetical protein